MDLRFRGQLTNLIWLLAMATAGNLLASANEQAPRLASSRIKVRTLVSAADCSAIVGH